VAGLDSPSLFIGLFLGLFIGSLAALAVYEPPGEVGVTEEVPQVGVNEDNFDMNEVASRTLEYISTNFLEPQGIQGNITSVSEYGENMVLIMLEIRKNGQLLDSTPVFVTRDGESLFVQPPLNTSETLEVPSPHQEEPKPATPTADDDPFLGDPDAPVTIIEFSDFQCPYCGAAMGTNDGLISNFKARDPTWEPAVPNIIKDYVETGKVKLVFRDFPLSFHDKAQKAAEAAECADEQGKFWDYHNILFENQDALAVDDLKGYAADLGLDTDQFNSCLDSGKYAAEVQKDMQDGQAAGVSGTPAYFINGQLVSGAQPYKVFKQIIEAELGT
jgi:protein-disulfide isomerase